MLTLVQSNWAILIGSLDSTAWAAGAKHKSSRNGQGAQCAPQGEVFHHVVTFLLKLRSSPMPIGKGAQSRPVSGANTVCQSAKRGILWDFVSLGASILDYACPNCVRMRELFGQNHMSDQTGRLSARQSDLLRAVRERGSAALADLAREFNVSQETIRRDVKTPGGRRAGPQTPRQCRHCPILSERRPSNAACARTPKPSAPLRGAPREMVEDGDSIILDTGTTTSIFARELLKRANLTVITNSSDIARTLATVNGNRVYMAGGELNGDNGAAFGPSAINFVAQFRAKHAMVTIAGLTAELGPMDSHLAEAEFARMVLSRGENRLILTDRSKFDRIALIKVCEFEDFDRLVTDAPPPSGTWRRGSPGKRRGRDRNRRRHPASGLQIDPVEQRGANRQAGHHQEQDGDDDRRLDHR